MKKLRNRQKEEDAKDELRRLIVLGSLNNTNTSKLPRTSKINFEVKTIVDPLGYDNPYMFHPVSRGSKMKNITSNRYDFKKHAKEVLNSSSVDETIAMQQLQNDRIEKIEDIERSLRADDRDRYLEGTDILSNMVYGDSSEFVMSKPRLSASLDPRRRNNNPYLNMKFEQKNIQRGRHQNDPFIQSLV